MAKTDPSIEYHINRQPKKRPKYDNALLGLILGILVPIIGLFLLYYVRWSDVSLSGYIERFTTIHNPNYTRDASKMVSLAVILNLIPFYLFKMKGAYEGLRGVVIATVLYLLLVILYMFVW